MKTTIKAQTLPEWHGHLCWGGYIWAALFISLNLCAINSLGQVISTLFTFSGGTNGARPNGGLVQAQDGNFYGTTIGDTNSTTGTVFRISPSGILSTLHSFSGGNDGGRPQAGLTMGADGKLYGTTTQGGKFAWANGTFFSVTTNGVFTTITNLDKIVNSTLALGPDNNFYGATENSSTNTIFRITPEGIITTLHRFTGGSDGSISSPLLFCNDGYFYGLTPNGGNYDHGTLFRMSCDGTLTTIYHFTTGTVGSKWPLNRLVLGSDGNFYGTIPYDQWYYHGSVFRVTPSGVFTTLYTFTGDTDGNDPQGLIQYTDGYLYGTTYSGGLPLHEDGTIFMITTGGALTTLYQFGTAANASDGGGPNGLIKGRDGNIYGTTRYYGMIRLSTNTYTAGQGTVFKILMPNIMLVGSNGVAITNGENATISKGTDLGFVKAGSSKTQTLSITNSGGKTLNILGCLTNGSGFFLIDGIPSSVPANSKVDITVRYSPTGVGNHNASLVIANTVTNYTVNLLGSSYDISLTNGPYIGGNEVTITNGTRGSGFDVTNILVGGVAATITGHGTNWVTFIVPATGSAGAKNIVIQSVTLGITEISGIYNVNPPGFIIGGVVDDWMNWQEVASLPAPRINLSVGSLNGNLYAIGGYSSYSETNVYRYNGANWTEVEGIPKEKRDASVNELNGALYVSGGNWSNVYKYDGTNWSEVKSAPRSGFSSGAFNGAIYSVGGGRPTNSVLKFNETNWTSAANLPAPRTEAAVAAISSGLYAFGGYSTQNVFTIHSNVYRFNGTSWTEVVGMPVRRRSMVTAVLNDEIYVMGGRNPNEYWTNAYRFNGTNWTGIPGPPNGCNGIGLGSLNGKIYAMGGYDTSSNAIANVWRYPGTMIASGISPDSGRYTGGYPVIIEGSYLGNGSDVTNVTICGVTATRIISQSSTQVVVIAGGGVSGLGDVKVDSTSYGATVKSNSFTYSGLGIMVTNGPHGNVTPAGAVDISYGASTSIVVSADTWHHIESVITNGVNVAGAVGRSSYTSIWMNVTAVGSLSATFAENLTSNTFTPEWWLAEHGWTNNFDAAATNDDEPDGFPTWQEYIADTDPKNPNSYPRITTIVAGQTNQAILSWPYSTGRIYQIHYCDDLVIGEWTTQQLSLGIGEWTDTNSHPVIKRYYRIAPHLP